METNIKNKLKEIEESHKIKILYACETGSRAWGFPSPDSDYDIRLIYMREMDWYLSLSEKKDTIELMLDNGDLDITGWDIKKCLKLMWKSNGALLERIQSPIVYFEHKNISSLLRQYGNLCYSPIASLHHYIGMAKTSFSDIEGKEKIKLKKLFYALRATLACKWIIEKDTVVPIVFMKMLDELNFEAELKTKINTLIELKSGKNEDYIHPMEKELNAFIAEELEKAKNEALSLKGRKQKEVDLDSLFLQIIKSN